MCINAYMERQHVNKTKTDKRIIVCIVKIINNVYWIQVLSVDQDQDLEQFT